jgi:putative ABC transport system permease protein
VRFTNRDLQAVLEEVDDIDAFSGRFYIGGESVVAYRDRSASFSVRSVHPGHRILENTTVVSGRFLDDLDVEERRKVCVIGEEVSRFLFRGASPLGAWITVAGIPFRVVGVFTDSGGEGEMQIVYLPVSTAQSAFGGQDQLHQMMFTVGDATSEDAARITAELRTLLAARHRFDPQDLQAIRVRNNVEEFEKIQRIFQLLHAFVWLVGIGTVTAGIVGVSNIMLVSVRERTVEIGLRKAIGATPARIVGAVVEEAVLLTAVSGYLGIVGGVAVLVALRTWVPESDWLREPQIHLTPAIVCAGLLVLFGGVAGFFPAYRAARIQPVEALRDAG